MTIITTNIRPLSVNQGYTGRRFKTMAHRMWEKSVMWLLPKNYKLPEPPYEIYFKFGFSSKSSDWDNAVKHFQDCLSKKYKFNDKLIRKATIEIDMVKKRREYVQWAISHLDDVQCHPDTIIY